MNRYGFDRKVSWYIFAAVCIAAGMFFFTGLDRLWPLADTDITADRDFIENESRRFLESRGFDLRGYESACRLTVAGSKLEYLREKLGRGKTQEYIRRGYPLYTYGVLFKKRGETEMFGTTYTPGAEITGWWKTFRREEAGESPCVEEARRRAIEAMEKGLGLTPSEYDEKSASTTEYPERTDYFFSYERVIREDIDLKEYVTAKVTGGVVTRAERNLSIPESAGIKARECRAPCEALETFGFILAGLACVAAFFYFLVLLRDGKIRLLDAAVFPSVVLACFIFKLTMSGPSLFRNWDPLWPPWISHFRYIAYSMSSYVGILLVLFIFTGAGDALDRLKGWNRGESLRKLSGGRIIDPSVAAASLNGFLTGLLCGGVIVLSVTALQIFAGAETGIQPRGFFFYPLNSVNPPLTALLFFLGVAFTEELGYRFFGGTWLLSVTSRKWIAAVVPGIVYGLTHTGFNFLPPAEPYWARPLILTLVGIVWGWAFLKFDALTVVLSHYTADLFIFNQPHIARGDFSETFWAVAVTAVPLIPAVLYLIFGPHFRRKTKEAPEPAESVS